MPNLTPLETGAPNRFVVIRFQANVSMATLEKERLPSNEFVISTGAQRSGEICGFPNLPTASSEDWVSHGTTYF
jgi:hypothetical protein